MKRKARERRPARPWSLGSRVTRGVVVALVLGSLVAVGPPGRSAHAVSTKPNILFILTDDQRSDAVPQLPKLNAQPSWMRFTRAFVEEPQCCPSRSTIFTGRYSHHTGVDTLESGAKLDESRTIATMLHSSGYQTGFLGKYLNGYPFGRGDYVPPGWDTFEAYEGATDYYNYVFNRNGTRVSHGAAPSDYSTDVWTSEARRFLSHTDPAKPFFLEVAYNAPHRASTGDPVPAPRDVGSCANVPFPVPPSFNADDKNSEPAWLKAEPRVGLYDMARQRRATCETLRAVDDGVVAIMNQLALAGRLANTYVVIMSDNGYEFGEHKLFGKGDLSEESVRVPLMVRGPGVVPGTTARLTSNVDLAPTFVEWAGAQAPTGFFDGASWAATARGDPRATQPGEVLLRGCRSGRDMTPHPCGGYPVDMGMNWGLRTANYEYVEYPNGERQLFDVVHDPYEMSNLASDPATLGIRQYLHSRIVARRGF